MSTISLVVVKPLQMHCDERGRLMEILRADDDVFTKKFGQVYMTTAYPGVVKAWHYHRKQSDHFTCIAGMMKLVLYDPREDSPTKGVVNEFFIGEHNTLLVVIPPMVYHGFKCVGSEEAIIVNTTSEPYNHDDPDEFRVDPHDNDIPYDWARKDG
jgi:dTDP-4-dehydrorhamnose 3,5-epimerase